jgi:hypothetical protein
MVSSEIVCVREGSDYVSKVEINWGYPLEKALKVEWMIEYGQIKSEAFA